MKNMMFVLVSCLIFLLACAKEEPKPPKQEVLTKAEEPKTSTMLVAEAKDKLTEAKAKLAEEGKYGCCIKEPCNMCVLAHGKCDCYEDLKKGEHVCTECYTGWQQGKGVDEKIKKEDVKTSLVEHKH